MFLPKIALNAIPFCGLYDEKSAAPAVRVEAASPDKVETPTCSPP